MLVLLIGAIILPSQELLNELFALSSFLICDLILDKSNGFLSNSTLDKVSIIWKSYLSRFGLVVEIIWVICIFLYLSPLIIVFLLHSTDFGSLFPFKDLSRTPNLFNGFLSLK